jgi:hypothetical protein
MAASVIANIPCRCIFLSQILLHEFRDDHGADKERTQFVLVNGSSLPNCSGMPCSLSLAVRA